MRDQDREVERSDGPLAGESHRADVRVVHEIADEKDRRGRGGRQHELAVRLDPAAPNGDVRQDEQHRARGIQRRVDGGEIGDRQAITTMSHHPDHRHVIPSEARDPVLDTPGSLSSPGSFVAPLLRMTGLGLRSTRRVPNRVRDPSSLTLLRMTGDFPLSSRAQRGIPDSTRSGRNRVRDPSSLRSSG